jgi:hypothetical protein
MVSQRSWRRSEYHQRPHRVASAIAGAGDGRGGILLVNRFFSLWASVQEHHILAGAGNLTPRIGLSIEFSNFGS